MRTNGRMGINLGYIAGFSSLAAAVVYFYASNWGGLERWQKFVPLFLFTIGLYGLSAYLAARPGRLLLARLSLLGSCISFGIGIAVVGQTYNSHADSYGLFAVWLVPALMFALISRWQPFYVLAYLLAHLAYGFYFMPILDRTADTIVLRMGILAGLASVQGLLFLLTETKRLHSPVIRFLSFWMLAGLLTALSNTHLLGVYGWWWSAALAAVLAGFVRYFKRTGCKMDLLMAGLAISGAVIAKYLEIAFRYFNEAFFISSFLFIVLFVGGNVWFLNYLQRAFPNFGTDNDSDSAAERERRGHLQWMVRLLTATAIIIGTVLGTISLLGILMVVIHLREPQPALTAIGLVFTAAMLVMRNANPIFRYTLLCSGLCIGVGTALVYDNEPMLGVYLVVLLAAFVWERGKVQRTFFYLDGLGLADVLLYDWLRKETIALTVLMAFLLLVMLVHRHAANEEMRLVLRYCSFPAFLLVFFILTFITKSACYYAANGLFFLTTLLGALWAAKRHMMWVSRFSLGFWMAYVCWKYYDTAWKLLHKSVSLAAAGILILLVVYLLEKRTCKERDEQSGRLPVRGGMFLAFTVVLLQLAVLSAQIGQNEWMLTHGQTVMLELAPRDPRSLLQGDYVDLRYRISNPEGVREELAKSYRYNAKVQVVLRPTASGVYEFKQLYTTGAALQPGEVVINGRWNGYNGLVYGIESYYIPEGTGREVEQTAKFAEVKVGKNGNAILVRLLSE